MTDWNAIRQAAEEFLCPMCRADLEELGPVYGPERPPKPPFRVERWSMTPAEWAGGWL